MRIEFREPRDIHEMEAIFKLRQEVYSADAVLWKMVDDKAELDINQYDFNANHFGAFNKGELIAAIRFSTAKATHQTESVKKIIKNHQIALQAKSKRFPFENYYPDQAACNNFIQNLAGKNIGEVGKLAIKPEYRKGFELLNQFIEAFIEYARNDLKVDTGLAFALMP